MLRIKSYITIEELIAERHSLHKLAKTQGLPVERQPSQLGAPD